MEPRTGGDKFDFFSPQALRMKPRDLTHRVGRVLLRALGARI
jgi:hypothetical protein